MDTQTWRQDESGLAIALGRFDEVNWYRKVGRGYAYQTRCALSQSQDAEHANLKLTAETFGVRSPRRSFCEKEANSREAPLETCAGSEVLGVWSE